MTCAKRMGAQFSAATALLFFTIASCFASPPGALTSFTVPWGDGPHQLGLIKGTEMESVGPLTFTVSPGEDIFVADTVHQAIKRYHCNGTFAGVVAERVRPTAMTFDSHGRLLILCLPRIFVMTEGGSLLAEVRLPENLGIVEGYGQDVFEEEGMVGVNNPDEIVSLFRENDPTPTTSSRTLLGRRACDGKRLFVTTVRGRVGAYELSEECALPNGFGGIAKLDRFRVADFSEIARREMAWQGGVLYKGWLSSRNAHVFETDAVQGKQVRLWLRLATRHGRMISRELPNGYVTTVYKKTEPRANGDAWQMLTTPEGVQFIQWRLAE